MTTLEFQFPTFQRCHLRILLLKWATLELTCKAACTEFGFTGDGLANSEDVLEAESRACVWRSCRNIYQRNETRLQRFTMIYHEPMKSPVSLVSGTRQATRPWKTQRNGGAPRVFTTALSNMSNTFGDHFPIQTAIFGVYKKHTHIWYHIIWYHIIWYHIIWYHIISYHV